VHITFFMIIKKPYSNFSYCREYLLRADFLLNDWSQIVPLSQIPRVSFLYIWRNRIPPIIEYSVVSAWHHSSVASKYLYQYLLKKIILKVITKSLNLIDIMLPCWYAFLNWTFIIRFNVKSLNLYQRILLNSLSSGLIRSAWIITKLNLPSVKSSQNPLYSVN